jgi:hypothetical protein
MRHAVAWAACCALALSLADAGAAVLYQQTSVSTVNSDRGAYADDCQQLADDFIPVATGALTQVTWQGSYYGTDNPNASVSFKVRLFADNAGTPADVHFFESSALASQTAAGTLLAKTLYAYSMNVSGPTLNAGTKYWIAINTNDPCNNYAWANSDDGPNGVLPHRSGDAGAWSNDPDLTRDNHVFSLIAGSVVAAGPQIPVPLLGPAGLALLAALVAWAGLLRSRERAARRAT